LPSQRSTRKPSTLDKRVAFVCRSYLRQIWHEEYGLSEEDVLGAANRAETIYFDDTSLTAAECTDRALDIAFAERDTLYDERVFNARSAA
jgi:hypothetical protein